MGARNLALWHQMAWLPSCIDGMKIRPAIRFRRNLLPVALYAQNGRLSLSNCSEDFAFLFLMQQVLKMEVVGEAVGRHHPGGAIPIR